MATYSTLKSRVLTKLDSTGVTDVGSMVEIGLEEAMRYVASKVSLPGLISSAEYQWQDGDTSASISSDFSVSGFEIPHLLFVKKSAPTIDDKGKPYDFLEYDTWIQLKAVPSRDRISILTTAINDELPDRSWTIESEDNVIILPLPEEDDYVTLFYYTSPAAYSDAGTPELTAQFHYILEEGARLIGDHYKKDPDEIIPYPQLLSGIDPLISELHVHLNSRRKRHNYKVAKSYRIRQ